MRIKEISYKTCSDFLLVTMYQKGRTKKRKKIIEQMWLKYQPLIRKIIKKHEYNIKSLGLSWYDIDQEMFFVFQKMFNKIDMNKINANFSFGLFAQTPINTHITNKFKIKLNKTRIENNKILPPQKTNIKIPQKVKVGSPTEDTAIENEVNSLYDTFKKSCSKKEQLMLNTIERLRNKSITFRAISKKLGFSRLSLFLYHRNKLKRKYKDFMKKYGYNLDE